MMMPVTYAASSEARKSAAPATSRGVPTRPSGTPSRMRATRASSVRGFMPVRIQPGPMQLTRMPCAPNSTAMPLVSMRTPPLLAE